MACGCAVIAANTSSLPEVVGREDALFDPNNHEEMRAKLLQVLTDAAFRQQLAVHALAQTKLFSWEKTAAKALRAFEAQMSAPRAISLCETRLMDALVQLEPAPRDAWSWRKLAEKIADSLGVD